MDDLIKKEGLLNHLCQSCVEERTNYIQDGVRGEVWFCEHNRVMVCWREHGNPPGFIFEGVTAGEYFASVKQARDLADESDAGLN
ncbi:MAG: hypothetical protein NPIRA05_00830 [Nitrospirales bacterium]|nr:MAG: hypothetical protein NPIRA05_00830 [Nitrospirales bacterium]